MPLKLFAVVFPLMGIVTPALAQEPIHPRTYSVTVGEGATFGFTGIALERHTQGQRGSAATSAPPLNKPAPGAAPSDSIRRQTVYFGAGASFADTSQDNSIPFSIGYLYRWSSAEYFVGLDFSGEGIALNNTSGRRNAPQQGVSTNLLFGPTWDLDIGGPRIIGAGFLLGVRTTEVSCPDSFLGYRCYADRSPEEDFSWNVGLSVHLVVPTWLLGIRVTTQSGQVTFGFNF